jgi:hypothetical protein
MSGTEPDVLVSCLHASRASRIAAREKPGGEFIGIVAADGVAGIVSNEVFPKRQRLARLGRPSLLDKPEELSVSDALLCPMSVVVASSATSIVPTAHENFCKEEH